MTGKTPNPPVIHVETPRRGSSMGIGSVILGILALFGCWIPFINVVSMPLSGLGILLALIGIIAALRRKGAGMGFPLAGGLINCLALGLAATITFASVKGLDVWTKASEAASKAEQATNQQVVRPTPDASATQVPTPEQPNAEQVAMTSDTALQATPEPTPTATPEEEWAPSDQPVRQGDVMIKILETKVGPVTVKDFSSDKRTTKEDYLQIKFEIQNLSKNKKIDYSPWQTSESFFGGSSSTLGDNFGNQYKRISFGISDIAEDGTRHASLYPGKALTDVLVFEPPVDGIEYLNLELQADNFGGTGKLRIRIGWMIEP